MFREVDAYLVVAFAVRDGIAVPDVDDAVADLAYERADYSGLSLAAPDVCVADGEQHHRVDFHGVFCDPRGQDERGGGSHRGQAAIKLCSNKLSSGGPQQRAAAGVY